MYQINIKSSLKKMSLNIPDKYKNQYQGKKLKMRNLIHGNKVYKLKDQDKKI